MGIDYQIISATWRDKHQQKKTHMNEKQLPEPGTYQARRSNAITVREEESGALMVYIPYQLVGDVQFSGTHAHCIGKKDGTLLNRAYATLRQIFPAWDGQNPFGLEELPLLEEDVAEFELGNCFHETYERQNDQNETVSGVSFKAQWLNPLGGGAPSKEPMDEAGRKKVITKWASKFKALSGTGPKPAQAPAAASKQPATPSKPAAPAKTAPPAKAAAGGPPRSPKTAGGQARTATLEEVWEALVKANPEESEDDLGTKFYAAQDEVAPDAGGELTPVQWGKVAEALGV
jgi:hypothetical protein